MPITYKIRAAINVVIFASKIVTNALEKPSFIANCGFFSLSSSRILEKINTFASTAIPTVRTIPAIPGKVSVAPKRDMMPVIRTKFIIRDIFAANPKTL